MTVRKTINKVVLKKIVKECLIEIFSEGLGDLEEQINEHSTRARTLSSSPTRPARNRRSAPRKPSPMIEQMRSDFHNEMKQEASEIARTAAGGDPMLMSMLQETLESGRVDEFEANDENVSPKDAMSQAIEHKTPDEIFGEKTVKGWAAAAFQGMDVPEE